MERKPPASKLAAQWISEQTTYDKRNEDRATQAVIELSLNDPHSLWPIVLEVASQTDDAYTLAMLGAGPLHTQEPRQLALAADLGR